MNKEKTINITLQVILIGSIFFLGWFGNTLYKDWNNKKTLDGMWLQGYNEKEAYNELNSLDNSGEWVCVNVDKTMSYKDIIETCEHEASHELFARKCTENVSKCMDVFDNEK